MMMTKARMHDDEDKRCGHRGAHACFLRRDFFRMNSAYAVFAPSAKNPRGKPPMARFLHSYQKATPYGASHLGHKLPSWQLAICSTHTRQHHCKDNANARHHHAVTCGLVSQGNKKKVLLKKGQAAWISLGADIIASKIGPWIPWGPSSDIRPGCAPNTLKQNDNKTLKLGHATK